MVFKILYLATPISIKVNMRKKFVYRMSRPEKWHLLYFAIIKGETKQFLFCFHTYTNRLWKKLISEIFWIYLQSQVKRTILLPCMPNFELEFRFISWGGTWYLSTTSGPLLNLKTHLETHLPYAPRLHANVIVEKHNLAQNVGLIASPT